MPIVEGISQPAFCAQIAATLIQDVLMLMCTNRNNALDEHKNCLFKHSMLIICWSSWVGFYRWPPWKLVFCNEFFAHVSHTTNFEHVCFPAITNTMRSQLNCSFFFLQSTEKNSPTDSHDSPTPSQHIASSSSLWRLILALAMTPFPTNGSSTRAFVLLFVRNTIIFYLFCLCCCCCCSCFLYVHIYIFLLFGFFTRVFYFMFYAILFALN